MLLEAYFVSLASIFVMELGDKTQLAVINLSATNKNPLRIFAGAVLAFSAINGLAVLLGEGFLRVVPASVMTKASGLLFIVLGVYTLLKKSDKEKEIRADANGAFYAAFASIFISEIGDKTQLSTILLATKFDAPVEVILGSLSALTLVTGLGVILGAKLADGLPRNLLKKAAGILFMIMGILTVLDLI